MPRHNQLGVILHSTLYRFVFILKIAPFRLMDTIMKYPDILHRCIDG